MLKLGFWIGNCKPVEAHREMKKMIENRDGVSIDRVGLVLLPEASKVLLRIVHPFFERNETLSLCAVCVVLLRSFRLLSLMDLIS
jgi:hypothetical protein